MNRYRAVLNGQNYTLEVDGQFCSMGFYTTRYVEASDPTQAELEAVDLIRKDEWLTEVAMNTPDPGPKIVLEELYQLEPDEEFPAVQPGLGWYREDDGEE